jgi:hypothetical protein
MRSGNFFDKDTKKKKVFPTGVMVQNELVGNRHSVVNIAAGNAAQPAAVRCNKKSSSSVFKASSRSLLWAAVGAGVSYLGIVAVGLICLAALHPVGLGAIAMAGLAKAMVPSLFGYKAMAIGSAVGFLAGSVFDQSELEESTKPKFSV